MNATEIIPLTDVLQRLEQQLELPHIAGELSAWADGVVKLLCEMEKDLLSAIEHEHPHSYDAIVKAQQNLGTQVETLREADQAILAAFPVLMRQAEQFASCVREDALAEQQFHAVRERLVNDGLAFVLRVRRQQVAVDTWSSEALQRAHGGGG